MSTLKKWDYKMKGKAKIIKKNIYKNLNEIDNKKDDKISVMLKKKLYIKKYYDENKDSIDTDTLIDLYNYYSENIKTTSDFFIGLITTLAFTMLWEIIFNKEDGMIIIFESFSKLIDNAVWLGKIVISILIIFLGLIIIGILMIFLKTIYNKIIELTLVFYSYETKELNEYHKEILNQIISQRKKIIENKIEYELKNEVHFDYRIEVYSIERIN